MGGGVRPLQQIITPCPSTPPSSWGAFALPTVSGAPQKRGGTIPRPPGPAFPGVLATQWVLWGAAGPPPTDAGLAGRTLYIQGERKLDFLGWVHAIQKAAGSAGDTLSEQQLTESDVPLLVDRCIDYITQCGMCHRLLPDAGGDQSASFGSPHRCGVAG